MGPFYSFKFDYIYHHQNPQMLYRLFFSNPRHTTKREESCMVYNTFFVVLLHQDAETARLITKRLDWLV